ncbi:hypothetical protein BX666DRAFT_13484 [Dichotomocladium elegans]|nr:hypothetical protein BX666DRAFT_13484 [Dichotomocladium elegans]
MIMSIFFLLGLGEEEDIVLAVHCVAPDKDRTGGGQDEFLGNRSRGKTGETSGHHGDLRMFEQVYGLGGDGLHLYRKRECVGNRGYLVYLAENESTCVSSSSSPARTQSKNPPVQHIYPTYPESIAMPPFMPCPIRITPVFSDVKSIASLKKKKGTHHHLRSPPSSTHTHTPPLLLDRFSIHKKKERDRSACAFFFPPPLGVPRNRSFFWINNRVKAF